MAGPLRAAAAEVGLHLARDWSLPAGAANLPAQTAAVVAELAALPVDECGLLLLPVPEVVVPILLRALWEVGV